MTSSLSRRWERLTQHWIPLKPLSPREPPKARGAVTSRSILARRDRLDVWSMPFLSVGIIGLGFLFTFYDVFDINVSFIQSCVALKPGCTPENALGTIRVPFA